MKSQRLVLVILGLLTVAVVALAVTLAIVLSGGDDDDAADATGKPSSSPSAPKLTPLERVAQICVPGPGGDTLTAADDDHTIIVDTRSEYGSWKGMDCVLGQLETSAAIEAQISATTAMMGVQTAEQDGITYQWSYHPDNGLNMTITDQ